MNKVECDESMDTNDKFPVISGALWELKDDWDCAGNDISGHSVSNWDGSTATIHSRADCAAKCLEAANCVAFNYPNNGGKCFWKHTNQKSTQLGKDCGSKSADYQYYTLLGKDC